MLRARCLVVGIAALAAFAGIPPAWSTPNATVGVYYFEGWYHDTPGVIAAFANAELRNDFPEREPIWGGGLWRGDTVPIMEQQIDLAADHGIAFFSFDWYWYGSQFATENDGINSGLKNFMLASNRTRMKFNINIVDVAPTAIGTDAEWEEVADMLLPLLTDPQYLRVGGDPLVTCFNAAGMTQTNYDYFQQIGVAAGLNAVKFAANVSGSTALYSHVTRYNAVPGWGAGETEYPYQSLTEYVEGNDTWAPGIWNTESGGPQAYIPTIMAGWDARPWNTPPSWYFNPTRTPAAVGAHLQKAIDWIDANPALATPERLVMVYAWNEFGEGGYITPTVGDPNGLYLDAIEAVVMPSQSSLDWGASAGVFFPAPSGGVLPQLGDEALAQLYLAPDGNIDTEIVPGGATSGDDIVLDSVVLRNDGNPQEDFAVFQRLFEGTYGTGTLYGVLFSSATAGSGDRYYRGPGLSTSGSPTSYDLNTDPVYGDSWNGTIVPGGSTVFVSWMASAGFIDALGNPILPNLGDQALVQLVYSADGVADNPLPGGIPHDNDVVLDARIITNNGGLWEDYGLFGAQEYRGPFQAGYVYGVVYEDPEPSMDDRYYAGPMEAVSAGVFYEFNTDFVLGDEWNGTIGAVKLDLLWGASGGFVDDLGDPILPNPGDKTRVQLVFSPDGIADPLLPGGVPAADDLVLDTGTVQNAGGGLAPYGVFGPLALIDDYQTGVVYGVIFEDDTPWTGDRYYAGPVQAAVANAGPVPDTYEMNRNLVDGDAWNRTVASGATAQFNWSAPAGFINDAGNPILPDFGDHTIAYLVYTPDNAADPILPGGLPGGNDTVLDRRVVTNNGGLWEDYGIFGTQLYQGPLQPGFVYGVIFADDDPQAGDRYRAGPLEPTAAFVSHEMNVDFVNGDMWNGTVIAQNLALDFDSDGMSNDFELRYFGDYTSGLPLIDSDSDGISNLGEYIADTGAMNSNSFLGVTSFLWEPAQVTLTLRDTSVRRHYRCEYTDNVLVPGAWTPLGAAIPGTGGDAAIVEGEGPAVPARVYRGTALLP